MAGAFGGAGGLAAVVLIVATPCAAGAASPVRTDGTLGPKVEVQGPTYGIDEALGQRRGSNLFHSFEAFGVPKDDLALFTGSSGIERVISRVTGGQVSLIDGRVAVAIPGADFILINPSGVTFGPEARLDVEGSVHIGSADEVRFPDGARFSASSPGSGRLTVAPPETFGFLGASGEVVLDRTDLTVAPGETLSLLGTNVRILDGSIRLRGGAGGIIQIAAPGAKTTVSLAGLSSDVRMTGLVHMTGVRRDADISSSDLEPPFEDGLSVTSPQSSGAIRIRAGRLVVEGGEIRADNTGALDSTALISIDAAEVRLRDNANVRSRAFAAGDAGEIRVTADRLMLLSGALVESSTQAAGDAGRVRVLANERILISREGSDERTDIASLTLGSGGAGTVLVRAPEVEVRDSGTIFSTTRIDASGDAGSVTVEAERILLDSGGQIGSATLDESRGQGGEVDVLVRDELIIRGESSHLNPISNRPKPSGIFTSSESLASAPGAAGDLRVNADRISLEKRGEIASEGFMNDARAGSVTVTFGDRLVVGDGEITTKANRADAGDVTVTGRGILELRSGGEISTSVLDRQSRGNAGTITVGADLLVINGGVIKANGVEGRGGDIGILANQLVRTADATVEALSEFGIAGSVSLEAPDTDLVSQLSVLPGAFIDTSSLLRPACAARGSGTQGGTFTAHSRGNLPPGPDAPLRVGYATTSGPLPELAHVSGSSLRDC